MPLSMRYLFSLIISDMHQTATKALRHEESRSFLCETLCLCVLVATFIKLKVLF